MKENKTVCLYIDTATKSLSLGAKVGDQSKTLTIADPKQALELTNLGIETLGKELGFALADVDCYYCLLGPGSNTGIRLGLTIPRTVYAFNPSIKIYGILTLKLFLAEQKNAYACLSDRSGNLFLGEMNEGVYSYRKLEKAEIASLVSDRPLMAEKEDALALEELKDYPHLVPISVIDTMMAHPELFEDFSSREEEFLPEYALAI
jgi:tRNA A37 threonylcarbamoyladenosine modification protein TsaB